MHILVIGYVWPESRSSAAGGRMLQLLQFLSTISSSVTFATTATSTNYMDELEKMSISTAKIELNNSSFDRFLEELDPEIVIFDRFMMEEQFGWRVDKYCPQALKILDTEDLHFLRKYREKEFKGREKNISLKNFELTKRELASIYRCDLSLIISEVEMQLLKKEFDIPRALLFYIPFLYEELTVQDKAVLPNFESREHFIFVGNFRHEPNVDAVLYLKDSIWPLIHKQLPKAHMLVYGAYPSSRIDQLHQPKQNFFIKGRAKDASVEVKKARICLAPLRFGAGLKGKLTEAMLCGTPSVTTSAGAEGIPGKNHWSGIVGNTPEEISDAAIALYTSAEKWKKSCHQGFKIINQRFSKKMFLDSFQSRIFELQNGLEKHREDNFTGGMLRHHRVKSTYFLSKYIEVKTELERLKKPPLY